MRQAGPDAFYKGPIAQAIESRIEAEDSYMKCIRTAMLSFARGDPPITSVEFARRNIERHYDLSNDMFASFLDPSLSYSSALFDALDPAPTFADLEEAQLRKVDAILDAAGVRRGSRVLEIGTGWGTLAIRAAQRGAQVEADAARTLEGGREVRNADLVLQLIAG